MTILLAHLILLAQQADPATPPASPTGGLPAMLFPIMILLALGYFMLVRPEKRKQADHKAMLQNLKKNDRVITVAGIKGTVANVHREANEVTVTVDESTGTKLRMTIDSITRVDGGKDAEESK